MSDLFHKDIPFSFVDKVFAIMMLCPQHIFQVLTKRTDRMLEYCKRVTDGDYIDEAAEMIVCDNLELFHVVEKLTGEAKKHIGPISITNELLPHLKAAHWAWDKTYTDWGKEIDLICEGDFPPQHIWLGTSIENQHCADQRREPLKGISDLGWMTWVSNEPCIGPIDWTGYEFIKWMVTGGESGNNARPMHPNWARQARDFCKANDVPFFFKQHGAWVEVMQAIKTERHTEAAMSGKLEFSETPFQETFLCNDGTVESEFSLNVVYKKQMRMCKVGKHASGRTLDGKTHDAYPVRNSQIKKL